MLRDRARDQSSELQRIQDTYQGKLKALEDDYRLDKKKLEDTSLDYKRQLLSAND